MGCSDLGGVEKRRGKRLAVRQFFSGEYYYGDYTKMNCYLIDKYHISLNLNTKVENPGIEEVDYRKAGDILEELKGYLNVSKEAVSDLKVFDVEELQNFFEKTDAGMV